jgi:hypothetical protein
MREEQQRLYKEEIGNTSFGQSFIGGNYSNEFDIGSTMHSIAANTFGASEHFEGSTAYTDLGSPLDGHNVHQSQMRNNGPFEDVLGYPGMDSKPRYTSMPNQVQFQGPIDPQLLAMDEQRTPHPMRYMSPEEALSSPSSNADSAGDSDMLDASLDTESDVSSIGIKWDGTQSSLDEIVKKEALNTQTEQLTDYPGEHLMGYQRFHLDFEKKPEPAQQPEITFVRLVDSEGQVQGVEFGAPESMQKDEDFARFAPVWERRNGYPGVSVRLHASSEQVKIDPQPYVVPPNTALSVAPATGMTFQPNVASQHTAHTLQPQPTMAPQYPKADMIAGQFVAPVAQMVLPPSVQPGHQVSQPVPPHTAVPYHQFQQHTQGWQGSPLQASPGQHMVPSTQNIQGFSGSSYGMVSGQAPQNHMYQPTMPVPQHTQDWQRLPQQSGQTQGAMFHQPIAPALTQQSMEGMLVPAGLQPHQQYAPPPPRTILPPAPPTVLQLLGQKGGGYYRKFPISFGHQRILTAYALENSAVEKRIPASQIPHASDADVVRFFKWHHSGDKKPDALVSFSPPPNVDLGLMGNLRVTVTELLTFFPSHVRWHDYLYRMRQNGWSNKHIAGFINYARQLAGDDAKKMTWVQQAVREADEGILKFKGTKERPLTNRPAWRTTGFTCANWAPYPKLQGNEATPIDYYLVDLADGVVNWPEGNGARLLTRAVQHAIKHGHRYVRISQIRQFLKECPEIVEPMLKPMAVMGLDQDGENPDVALIEELKEMIEADIERVGLKTWRARKGTTTGLTMGGVKKEESEE